MSEQPESTLRPDGWVGDAGELDKARRYRSAIRWGNVLIFPLFAAFWFVPPPIDVLFIALMIGLVIMDLVLQRKITKAIGRKWTFSLEMKEKRLEMKENQRQKDDQQFQRWFPRNDDITFDEHVRLEKEAEEDGGTRT